MSVRSLIDSPVATIVVGEQRREFKIHKNLLCDCSSYFKAALDGPFIEGEQQKIILDDEDPAVFQTFAAWLYQGRLVSEEISEEFTNPKDFETHIFSLFVFADKRSADEQLLEDIYLQIMDYLYKTGLAQRESIQKIFALPSTPVTKRLQGLLVNEEIYFRHRILRDDFKQFPRSFVAEVCKKLAEKQNDLNVRELAKMGNPDWQSSLWYLMNSYHGSTTVVLPGSTQKEPPSKKRKTT